MSIEHIVLVRVIPGKEVQHTALMPLFRIPNRLSLSVNDHYASSELEKIALEITAMSDDSEDARPEKAFEKDERIRPQYRKTTRPSLNIYRLENIGAEGNPGFTFFALTHFFDAAARRRMPRSRTTPEGRLPNEIYGQILSHVQDSKTWLSCIEVSNSFRRWCQENYVLTNGKFLRPCTAIESCLRPGSAPYPFSLYDVPSGTEHRAKFEDAPKRNRHRRPNVEGKEENLKLSYKVAIGTGYDTKSLLINVEFEIVKESSQIVP